MNINFIKYSIISLMLIFVGSSCSDWLEEEVYDFLSGDTIEDASGYDVLVAGAYETLAYPFEWNNYHNIVNVDCDYQSGPYWAFAAVGSGNFYDHGNVLTFYEYYFQGIHRCNYHMHLIKGMDLNEEIKQNALGELAFLKAWCYFSLVQFFGDLPLRKTSVNENPDFYIPRSPIKDVYEHIIEELKFAENALFPKSDPRVKKGHVTAGAAKALLTKVYCTIGSASMPAGANMTIKGGKAFKINDETGDKELIPYPQSLKFQKDQVAGYEEFNSQEYYKLAIEKAAELIDSREFELAGSQKELWSPANKNGKEFIFTLQTIPDDQLMANHVPPYYYGWADESKHGAWKDGIYIQRDHWYQLFDYDDERIRWGVLHRIPLLNGAGDGVDWYYYPLSDSTKVKRGEDGYLQSDKPIITEGKNSTNSNFGAKLTKYTQHTSKNNGDRCDFNWPFLRYADVILLYCEAHNEVNGPTGRAISEMEKLNTRNNSARVSELGSWDKESYRSYIFEERAKELAGEGWRKFDLLRWGVYLQTMNAIGTDEKEVSKVREKRHLLLPIPSREINLNPFVDSNNPGW